MPLLKRQEISQSWDDQSPMMFGNYVGNWTHFTDKTTPGFNNFSCTVTPTVGSSFSLTFKGTQIVVYGGVLDPTFSYPTANYMLDGVASGPQGPYVYSLRLIYFKSPKVSDGTHTLTVTVTAASAAQPFVLDEISTILSPSNGGGGGNNTETSPSISSGSATAKPIGAIIGGTIGGVGVLGIFAILLVLLHHFLKKSRRRQDDNVEKPRMSTVMANEYQHEPFNPAASGPSSPTSFNRPGPQFAHSEGSSNQQFNPFLGQTPVNSYQPQNTQPGPNQTGQTYVTGNMPQQGMQKGAMRSQQYQNVQHSPPSSEARSAYTEVPPSYGPH